MKRFAIFALPVLATIFAVVLGFLLFRTQGALIKPRIAAARGAVAEAVEEVAEKLEEAIE